MSNETSPGPVGDYCEAGRLTEAELSALLGDDIGFWVRNSFMDRELLIGKICWWINSAVAARDAAAVQRGRAAVLTDFEALADEQIKHCDGLPCPTSAAGRNLRDLIAKHRDTAPAPASLDWSTGCEAWHTDDTDHHDDRSDR